VLNDLPAGSGSVVVESFTPNIPFVASGIQYPYIQAGNTVSVAAKFQ
jgi:hypothetical protein